jgi:hypothetical protein
MGVEWGNGGLSGTKLLKIKEQPLRILTNDYPTKSASIIATNQQ